jgi:hypothetical protein
MQLMEEEQEDGNTTGNGRHPKSVSARIYSPERALPMVSGITSMGGPFVCIPTVETPRESLASPDISPTCTFTGKTSRTISTSHGVAVTEARINELPFGSDPGVPLVIVVAANTVEYTMLPSLKSNSLNEKEGKLGVKDGIADEPPLIALWL